MAIRACKVSVCDLKGVEHSVEVTAQSVFEAVAQGLRIFRESDWIEEIGRGQTMLVVTAKQPEVEHKIRMRDFEHWLESEGRTPAEVALKNRVRELLKSYSATVGSGGRR